MILCMIAAASIMSHAQQKDSARQKADTTIHSPVIPGLQSPDLKGRQEFKPENSVILLESEVPPVLRKVLQQEEYRGWETGKVFRHMSTGEFKVEVVHDPYLRVFYFDKDGERIVE